MNNFTCYSLELEWLKKFFEMCFLFTLNSESYVIGFADSEGETLPANMERGINQKHKAMKQECLEYVSDGETLYYFFSK